MNRKENCLSVETLRLTVWHPCTVILIIRVLPDMLIYLKSCKKKLQVAHIKAVGLIVLSVIRFTVYG